MVYDSQMFGYDNSDGMMMELNNIKGLEDDWLAPINETLQATQLDGNQSMRRVYSAPAVKSNIYNSNINGNHNWNTSTAPLPIRSDIPHGSFPHHTGEDHYSSIESSQTLLAGQPSSFTDESAFLHRQASFPNSNGYRATPTYNTARHHSLPNTVSILDDGLTASDALAAVEIFPAPPPAPPGQAGHWAWIPATASGPTLVSPPSAPTPVAISTAPLPLPVPMGSTLDLDDLDLDLLDSINVLEMADSLVPEKHRTHHHNHNQHPRAVGSCPLPMLLENSLSNDDGSSDHTMQRTSSPPIDEIELHQQAVHHHHHHHHHVTSSPGSNNHASSRHGIPIPGATSAPMKVQRPSRSLSSSHLASALLATSCPSSSNNNRPMRNAARRSLAATVAALKDVDEDSDSDVSDDGLPSSFFGTGSQYRRSSQSSGASLHRQGSAGGNGSSMSLGGTGGKKKHNPWTLEETLALVEGVHQAGVGKWAEIKRLSSPGIAAVLESRSPVDLKDKWRNLTRVARLPKAALKARLQRGPSDVPYETMLLVKQLMEARQDAE